MHQGFFGFFENERMVCPRCKGERYLIKDKDTREKVCCPICKGDGFIDAPEEDSLQNTSTKSE